MDTSHDAQPAAAAEPATITPPPNAETNVDVVAESASPKLPAAATLEIKPEPIVPAAIDPPAAAPPPQPKSEPAPRIEPQMRAEPSLKPLPPRAAEGPDAGGTRAGPRPNPARKAPMLATPIPNPGRDRKEQGQGARGGRLAVLAASIAIAASIGGALGAAGFATASKMMAPAAVASPSPGADEIRAEIKALRDSVTQTRASVKTIGDSVATLRANVDNAGKSTGGQFAKVNESIGKIGEAVDRLERSQSEPAARLAKVVETLERLEKRAGAEPTGSLAQSQPARQLGAPPQTLQQQAQQQPSQPQQVAAAEPKPAPGPAIVDGWTLRRVYDGAALIEGRVGVVEVEPGDNVRGLGRVNEIKRQDGRWVVVTSRGLIVTR